MDFILLDTPASNFTIRAVSLHCTKASTVYVGYARRRVPTQADAKRRLLARGEVAFAKQMTEGALQPSQSASPPALPKGEPSPLSRRVRGDSSPINGGAFGAVFRA